MEDSLEDDPPTDATELVLWKKKDKKARAVIGLTLSNDMLENVREADSAKKMWKVLKVGSLLYLSCGDAAYID